MVKKSDLQTLWPNVKFLIESYFETKVLRLANPSKKYVSTFLLKNKLKMFCFFAQTNIARQPFPYTSNCINGWDETDLDISTNVNYSLAVSQIFTC